MTRSDIDMLPDEVPSTPDESLAAILTPDDTPASDAPSESEAKSESAPENTSELAAEQSAPPAETTAETPVEAPAPEPVKTDKKDWYIVKVQSNREDSIKEAIERRVKIEGLEEYFGQILVPVEKVSTQVGGKRVVRSRKMYPGYIMAYVEFNDRILYLFRETSGVGDFVGASMNRPPAPMPPREVERMINSQLGKAAGREQVVEKIKVPFEKGDKVRVRDGTFSGMEGEVKEVIEPKDVKENPRIRIELTIFGRPVPVEVEHWQVEEA